MKAKTCDGCELRDECPYVDHYDNTEGFCLLEGALGAYVALNKEAIKCGRELRSGGKIEGRHGED